MPAIAGDELLSNLLSAYHILYLYFICFGHGQSSTIPRPSLRRICAFSLSSTLFIVQRRVKATMAESNVNFLGGSPLNRLSWLRTSTPFLSAIVTSPNTRWIVFNNGQPLVRHAETEGLANESEVSRSNGGSKWSPTKPASGSQGHSLAALPTSAVLSLLGPPPFFGQNKAPGMLLDDEEQTSHTEGARLHGPHVVFLGLHEPSGHGQALPSSEFSSKTDSDAVVKNIKGTPYFSVDVAGVAEDVVKKALEESEREGKLEFAEPRSASAAFSMFEAAIFAEARSMLDWNMRNKVRLSVILVRERKFIIILLACVSSALVAGRRRTRYGLVGNGLALRYYHGQIILEESHVLLGTL